MDVVKVFGRPLERDPELAISTDVFRFPETFQGPAHRAQYVVEIAGPHSVPAQAILELTKPHWVRALGSPELWVMGAADQAWRKPLTSDASYDSVALTWDLESDQGTLTPDSCRHLASALAGFAEPLGRRAMAVPIPDDIPKAIRERQTLLEQFDLGIELGLAPSTEFFREKDLWIKAVGMGFDLGGSGVFELRDPRWPLPLLSLTPWEPDHRFSLAQVAVGGVHEAIGIGFNVPTSPDPLRALEVAFAACALLADELNGTIMDEDGHLLTEDAFNEMRSQLELAVKTMERAGIAPGSPTAMKLFGAAL